MPVSTTAIVIGAADSVAHAAAASTRSAAHPCCCAVSVGMEAADVRAATTVAMLAATSVATKIRRGRVDIPPRHRRFARLESHPGGGYPFTRKRRPRPPLPLLRYACDLRQDRDVELRRARRAGGVTDAGPADVSVAVVDAD